MSVAAESWRLIAITALYVLQTGYLLETDDLLCTYCVCVIIPAHRGVHE